MLEQQNILYPTKSPNLLVASLAARTRQRVTKTERKSTKRKPPTHLSQEERYETVKSGRGEKKKVDQVRESLEEVLGKNDESPCTYTPAVVVFQLRVRTIARSPHQGQSGL